MNDIFVLYKQKDLTKTKVTTYKKDLTSKFEKARQDVVIKEFETFINDDNYRDSYDENKFLKYFTKYYANLFESNRSSILLCFIDDEFFYDIQCRAIWSSFWSRQQSKKRQLIFPVLIEQVNTTNFDRIKLEIYDNAKTLGFYELIDDSSVEKSALYEDIAASVGNKEVDPRDVVDGFIIKTNVHSVYEIEDSFIEAFKICNDSIEQSQSQRFVNMQNNIDMLRIKLDDAYNAKFSDVKKVRKYSDGDAVCVLYTGGTAGMILDPDENDSLDLVQAELSQLVQKLPRLKKEEFEIDFYSFKTPLDSSNITSGHWLVMASVIEILESKYQGFVIIHGANTMAYTASALSFLLDNVDKPIILTGSELALDELNNDAEQNIQRSIEIAAHKSKGETNVPEVCILFGRRLILGNRSTKQIALDTTEGFYSPNYPELAPVSHDRVVIDSSRSRTPIPNKTITMNKHMASSPKIVICDVYPDMDMALFQHICNQDDVGAVIIRTYGTGGIPNKDPIFVDCLEKLKKERHTIVVNLTQCPKGTVEFRFFETNATLFNLGVISGGDMVTEAAYCKLKHLFSKFESFTMSKADRARIIKHYMMVSMRGEMSMSMFIIPVPLINNYGELYKLPANWYDNPAKPFYEQSDVVPTDSFAVFNEDAYISNAVLRLGSVQFTGDITDIGEGKKEIQPQITVSVSIDQNACINNTAKSVSHNRKYSYDSATYEGTDINIDILSLAREELKASCKDSRSLFISIRSDTHVISRLESINILLSTVSDNKDR
jgi:L-asparaginase